MVQGSEGASRSQGGQWHLGLCPGRVSSWVSWGWWGLLPSMWMAPSLPLRRQAYLNTESHAPPPPQILLQKRLVNRPCPEDSCNPIVQFGDTTKHRFKGFCPKVALLEELTVVKDSSITKPKQKDSHRTNTHLAADQGSGEPAQTRGPPGGLPQELRRTGPCSEHTARLSTRLCRLHSHLRRRLDSPLRRWEAEASAPERWRTAEGRSAAEAQGGGRSHHSGVCVMPPALCAKTRPPHRNHRGTPVHCILNLKQSRP